MSEVSLGVVIVAYNSGSEIVDCCETLLASAQAAGLPLRVVVVDNDSTDDTVAQLQDWAGGAAYTPPADQPFEVRPLARPLTLSETSAKADAGDTARDGLVLIRSGENLGYAGGVNLGLAHLARNPALTHFWVLNPDTLVPPDAIGVLTDALVRRGDAPLGLMGGRVCYTDPPDRIQTDGGTLNMVTGVSGNLNLGQSARDTPQPDAGRMAFVMGGNMIASRAFYDLAGPMREEYFLYYEEIDWALARGALPLEICPGLVLYHRAGTAIGSPVHGRPASPFSLFFKHRARMMFLRRHNRVAMPAGYAYTLAFAARLLWRRAPAEAAAVLRGAFGMAPPAAVAARLGPRATQIVAAHAR